jgi:hypothetical protein
VESSALARIGAIITSALSRVECKIPASGFKVEVEVEVSIAFLLLDNFLGLASIVS